MGFVTSQGYHGGGEGTVPNTCDFVSEILVNLFVMFVLKLQLKKIGILIFFDKFPLKQDSLSLPAAFCNIQG